MADEEKKRGEAAYQGAKRFRRSNIHVFIGDLIAWQLSTLLIENCSGAMGAGSIVVGRNLLVGRAYCAWGKNAGPC